MGGPKQDQVRLETELMNVPASVWKETMDRMNQGNDLMKVLKPVTDYLTKNGVPQDQVQGNFSKIVQIAQTKKEITDEVLKKYHQLPEAIQNPSSVKEWAWRQAVEVTQQAGSDLPAYVRAKIEDIAVLKVQEANSRVLAKEDEVRQVKAETWVVEVKPTMGNSGVSDLGAFYINGKKGDGTEASIRIQCAPKSERGMVGIRNGTRWIAPEALAERLQTRMENAGMDIPNEQLVQVAENILEKAQEKARKERGSH